MSDSTPPKLIQLYKDMADFTLPECKSVCRVPYSCCSPEHCDFSMDFAMRRGVELRPTGHPKLPMMGETGCIVPPHLRPMCTVHTCEISSMGFKKHNPDRPYVDAAKWTSKYFDLRSKIEEEEMKLLDMDVEL